MATLYKRSNGRFYAQFFDLDRSPARKQVSLRTTRAREASIRLRELEQARERGEYDPWQDVSLRKRSGVLSDAVRTFIRSRSNLSPYTRTKYRSVLGLLVKHLGERFSVSAIRSEHVERFLSERNLKPITRKTYSTTLSPFFNWLKARREIERNPMEGVRLEKAPTKFPRYLSRGDVSALCGAIRTSQQSKHATKDSGAWLLPIIRANVYLGLRAGELVNLKWEHVDLKRRTLTVANTDAFRTKSVADRILPLCEQVVEILSSQREESEYVFVSYGGKQVHRQYLSRAFKHYARRADLDHLNWHSTRHTAASWLAEAGCSVEAIRRYMGHSSIMVTQKYMHLSPDGFANQIERSFAAT